MCIEGKDRNGIWIVTTFIMIPLGIFTFVLGIVRLIKLDSAILATLVSLTGAFIFFYGLFMGKENKYSAVIKEEYLMFKYYPFFIRKKVSLEDIVKIILITSRQGVYGEFEAVMITRKGVNKSLYFSSFSIVEKGSFEKFVDELSSRTNIQPTKRKLNEFQKAILMIFN